MEKPNIKLYLGIAAVIFVLVVVWVILISLKNNSGTPKKPSSSAPTPTLMPIGDPDRDKTGKNTSQPSGNLSPTLIPVVPFTGVGEDQHISKEETSLAIQKQSLRKKTPLNETAFTISFDYAGDVFIVALNEPKETNKSAFIQWLNANYSLIPLDRFEFR